ncbi:MAG: hypothetical protein WC547_02920 [Candidatus Omnitrophota bacterium]
MAASNDLTDYLFFDTIYLWLNADAGFAGKYSMLNHFMPKKGGVNSVQKNVKLGDRRPESGFYASIVAKKYIEPREISKIQKVSDFFVHSVVTVLGRIRIFGAAKMLLIGSLERMLTGSY